VNLGAGVRLPAAKDYCLGLLVKNPWRNGGKRGFVNPRSVDLQPAKRIETSENPRSQFFGLHNYPQGFAFHGGIIAYYLE